MLNMLFLYYSKVFEQKPLPYEKQYQKTFTPNEVEQKLNCLIHLHQKCTHST